jgi:hypothetical protein
MHGLYKYFTTCIIIIIKQTNNSLSINEKRNMEKNLTFINVFGIIKKCYK